MTTRRQIVAIYREHRMIYRLAALSIAAAFGSALPDIIHFVTGVLR